MKHLKLFENFNSEDVQEFMSFSREKFLELSDMGFTVKVEDKNSEPLLENMIRMTIKERRYQPFKFSEVSSVIEEILLINIGMGPLHKKTHVVVIPEWRENHQGERLSYIFSGNECQWYFEGKSFFQPSLNPLNLSVKCVELFFE